MPVIRPLPVSRKNVSIAAIFRHTASRERVTYSKPQLLQPSGKENSFGRALACNMFMVRVLCVGGLGVAECAHRKTRIIVVFALTPGKQAFTFELGAWFV